MPCIGGGGPSMGGKGVGTAMVLQKNGDKLRLRVFGADGRTLLDRDL